jgi:hypothetical protein
MCLPLFEIFFGEEGGFVRFLRRFETLTEVFPEVPLRVVGFRFEGNF